jgi:hypothetical protein
VSKVDGNTIRLSTNYPITIDFSGVLLGPEKKLYCFFDGEVFFVDREFLIGA